MADFKRIVPVLKVSDMQKSVDFYTGVLGFTVDWKCRQRVVTVAHSLCPRDRREVRP